MFDDIHSDSVPREEGAAGLCQCPLARRIDNRLSAGDVRVTAVHKSQATLMQLSAKLQGRAEKAVEGTVLEVRVESKRPLCSECTYFTTDSAVLGRSLDWKMHCGFTRDGDFPHVYVYEAWTAAPHPTRGCAQRATVKCHVRCPEERTTQVFESKPFMVLSNTKLLPEERGRGGGADKQGARAGRAWCRLLRKQLWDAGYDTNKNPAFFNDVYRYGLHSTKNNVVARNLLRIITTLAEMDKALVNEFLAAVRLVPKEKAARLCKEGRSCVFYFRWGDGSLMFHDRDDTGRHQDVAVSDETRLRVLGGFSQSKWFRDKQRSSSNI